MNTTKKATKVQGTKIAKGTKVSLTNLSQTASTSKASKKVDTKKESKYKTEVLESNKLLKQESVKLGYCVKVLINNTNILKLSPLMIKNLNAINKDSEAYKLAVLNCRKSKKGSYSPFYLLQYLYSISK